MHHRARDLTGMRSNYLTAIRYAGSDGKKSYWDIKCDCGNVVKMAATEFLKGKIKSCGCQRYRIISEARKTHGMSRHPAYAVWRAMIDRCRLPSHQAWKNYGGRGIMVCEKWVENFENFWNDMGTVYKKGLSLDRINVDGNYCPENCRWVSAKTQNRNRRSNRYAESPLGYMTIAELSEISGIGITTLIYRLDQSVPIEHLLDPPDSTNRFMTS